MKIYKIYGAVQFIFDGNSDIFIKVTKETKDYIKGYVVDNWSGNWYGLHNEEPIISKIKITIVKRNIQGWIDTEEEQ